MKSPQALHVHSFPLRGSHLIEASAGTGKTWTIAALYVRLVLGHGADGAAPVRPLMPPDILVMTFTRAATRELSDRIRARLAQAAQVFRGSVQTDEEFLLKLLAEYPSGQAREQAAHRLALAAQTMDEAAVYTIDAWCQRMLREHAFDSGNLFEENLVADEAALRLQAVQDYWRQQLYPLQAERVQRVREVWKDVTALEDDLRDLLDKDLPEGEPDPLAQVLERVQGEREAALTLLKTGWASKADTLRQWLQDELAPPKHHWNGQKLQARYFNPWLDALRDWANTPGDGPALEALMGDNGYRRFTPEGLMECRKADAPSVALPGLCHEFVALTDALAQLPDVSVALRLHARTAVRARLAELKRRSGLFGFADMLQRLATALARPGDGERLAQRLRRQFPVALVDEFQDTSPLQLQVFDAIYRLDDHSDETTLLLIGDPKQSIYGFRGADIHSYLQARRATEGRHHVLGTNHRSTAEVVSVVNHFFALGQALAGGAFDYRTDAQDPVPFIAVQAKGRPEALHTAQGRVPALTWVHDSVLRSQDEARRHQAACCAEQIVAWLADPQTRYIATGQSDTPLQARDIAVLVRNGKEADAVRSALRARGVASVYLSDRDSVFASDEARDLCLWLQGVATPQDLRAVRAALGTGTVGLSLSGLYRLASDDAVLDAQAQQLRELRQVWQAQGVLAMLRQSLHRLQLAERWRQQSDGERRLTNVLHLAELLQNASQKIDGEQALIRWLAQAIEDTGQGQDADEQVLRLESDASLVQVITIHKSKGLEYPIVCLPFAQSLRRVERKGSRVLPHESADGQREWVLDFDDEDVRNADRDRLREDLRLWYVALTRARHALWVGWSPIRVGHSKACQNHLSAPGRLLGGGHEHKAEDWGPVVRQALAACGGNVRIEEAPLQVPFTPWVPRPDVALPQAAKTFSAPLDRRWTIASFSRMARDLSPMGTPAPAQELPLALQMPRPADDEPESAAGDAPARVQSTAQAWHRFARGPSAGNFLHEQLEWLAADGFALSPHEPHRRLQRACERAGFAEQSTAVQSWLARVVRQPLTGPGVALQALAHVLPEMEFWLPAGRLDTPQIDQLCRTHLMPGVPRPGLPQSQLHGMLMGFADLVFEHEGRYWVLDYKSNHLGADDAAYSAPALQAAMASHRYDVQAALYLLALHRLLRVRLGAAYDPGQHLGGAVYLFLRGIDGPAGGCCTLPAPLPLLQALDAMLEAEPLL
jgi:exodeoxyribonuclease V beta subunit